jgi:hypothetical protein
VEALKLAFDTIIVGALALPWLAMGIYLFLGSKKGPEGPLERLWTHYTTIQDKIPAAAGAVLLFAITYSLGAAVSRVSSDFFNDEDLYIPITEDRIRATVFCADDQRKFFAALANQTDLQFPPEITPKSFATNCAAEPPEGRKARAEQIIYRREQAEQIFHVQESALLLVAGDRLETLNQLHAQIAVLRGAAFNGLILSALCLFGLGATQQAKHPVAWIIPIVFLAAGGTSMWNHSTTHGFRLNDPPFMECTLLILSLTAGVVMFNRVPQRSYGVYLLESLLMTAIAYFGWWWSEVLYDRQVLHMFYAQAHHLLTSP